MASPHPALIPSEFGHLVQLVAVALNCTFHGLVPTAPRAIVHFSSPNFFSLPQRSAMSAVFLRIALRQVGLKHCISVIKACFINPNNTYLPQNRHSTSLSTTFARGYASTKSQTLKERLAELIPEEIENVRLLRPRSKSDRAKSAFGYLLHRSRRFARSMVQNPSAL